MLYWQGQRFPQPLGGRGGGCLTVSHTGRQVLGAESQPQPQLPSLGPGEGWGELDSPACGTGTPPQRQALCRAPRPTTLNTAHVAPTRPGALRTAWGHCWLPRKEGGCSASRNRRGRSGGALKPQPPEMAGAPLCRPRTLTAVPCIPPCDSLLAPGPCPHHMYLPC